MNNEYRWHADIRYRQENGGSKTLHFSFDEIEDLHDIIEDGPHWDTILDIAVRRNPANLSHPNLTLEMAEAL